MKVVILGSGSFAGHIVYSHLIQCGHQVFGINRSNIKSPVLWPSFTPILKYNHNWLVANILDDLPLIANAVQEFQPDYIIDFMGQGMVSQSWADPTLWYQTNIVSKVSLINSFLKLPSLKKYIRASTPEVFGSSEEFMTTTSPFNPSTPYAVSHAAIDFHIRCLGRQYNFPYVLARFANYYGPGQQLYRVIPKAILSCLTNSNFILDGGGSSARSFIYSTDICSSIDSIMDSPDICIERHYSGNEEISIFDLIAQICNLTNTNFSSVVTLGPERPGKDMFYRLDCSSSLSHDRWSPTVHLRDGLISMIGWLEPNLTSLITEPWTYQHRR